MYQTSREQRILEKISSKKKTVKKKIKRVAPNSRVKTSAETIKTMLLSILNNKNLKSSERLEKVMLLLKKKHHLLRVMLLTINQFNDSRIDNQI